MPNQHFLVPEYKIELLNKSKKPIKIIENINKIKLTKAFETKSTSKSTKKTDKKVKTKSLSKNLKLLELYGQEEKQVKLILLKESLDFLKNFFSSFLQGKLLFQK